MITEPKFEDRAEQPYVGIRKQVTMQEFGSGVIPQALDEVFSWLDQHGVAPAGAPIIRYHVIDMADRMDVEMGVPVAKAVSGDERIAANMLPAGRYASVLYTGDYSGLMEANRVLIDWAKANGIAWDRWDDPHGDAFRSRFEAYLTDPEKEPNPEKWETEVVIKVADR